MIVFGNIGGILNLIVFLVLITFLTAIFAAQIFRGEIPASDDMGAPNHITFFTMFNSFLGMYHVLSSENWTSTLYSVTSNTKQYGTAWIGATFLVLWFILSNCRSQYMVKETDTDVLLQSLFLICLLRSYKRISM